MILYSQAKVNLSLYITGKRPDGYHTIDTVFQPLTLSEKLTVEPAGKDSFSCSDPQLETESNLALRALQKLRESADFPPVALHLEKQLPYEAGLGGGSGDAAAVLKGINERFHLGYSIPQLETVGAGLGADVPALLHPGPTRGKGTGTELLPLASRLPLFFLIVKPSVSCSTAAMYRAWDESGQPSFSKAETQKRQEALEEALARGDIRTLAGLLHNDFEALLPGEAAEAFERISRRLSENGALKSQLCGSGSAVFGLFETKEERDKAYRVLCREFPPSWMLACCEERREEPLACSVILAAGGSGSRFGGNKNKLFAELNGRPVLAYSLKVFLNHPSVQQIVIPCRRQDREEIERIARELAASGEEAAGSKILYCEGGRERQDSVRAALALCREPHVLIHDAARPFVKPRAVDECLEMLRYYPAVSLAIPSRDTVKLTNERGEVCETTDRSRTWLIQTPQGFRTELLCQAHESGRELQATDDCMLMEHAGYTVRLIPGAADNLKITFPEDLRQ